MKITLNNEFLDSIIMHDTAYLIDQESVNMFKNKSGINEYRLYSYLSLYFNNSVILDIGTNTGRSAIALASNPTNQVITYNLVDDIRNSNAHCYKKKNVVFKIRNVLDDLNTEMIKDVKLILIDIDHFGNNERNILDRLEDVGFNGLVILDDTFHPEYEMRLAMQKLWRSIKQEKYDISQYGHYSGTGLVVFGDFKLDLVFE